MTIRGRQFTVLLLTFLFAPTIHSGPISTHPVTSSFSHSSLFSFLLFRSKCLSAIATGRCVVSLFIAHRQFDFTQFIGRRTNPSQRVRLRVFVKPCPSQRVHKVMWLSTKLTHSDDHKSVVLLLTLCCWCFCCSQAAYKLYTHHCVDHVGVRPASETKNCVFVMTSLLILNIFTNNWRVTVFVNFDPTTAEVASFYRFIVVQCINTELLLVLQLL